MTTKPKRTYTGQFEATRIMGRLLRPAGLEWDIEPQPQHSDTPLLLHISCNAHYTLFIVYIAQEILKKLGLGFAVLGGPENCCGSFQAKMGDVDLATQATQKALLGFRRIKPTLVLSVCPDCDTVFNDFGLKGTGFESENISELFVRELHRLKEMMRPVERRVVIHYHDVNPARVRDSERIRTLLSAIPGLEIVPARHNKGNAVHCQTFNPMPPEQQRRMIDEACALGADTLAVPYHSCYRQHCKLELEHPIDVQHYTGLLAESLGIAFDDPFKRLRLLNDVEKTMGALAPAIAAAGYDEDLVRPLVERGIYC